MQRMTITTEIGIFSLGDNGVESFFYAFGEYEIKALQPIDDVFLSKIDNMPVKPVGFTMEVKDKLFEHLTAQKGNFCLITSDFITDLKCERSIFLGTIVKLTNQGLSLMEALQRYHVTKQVVRNQAFSHLN